MSVRASCYLILLGKPEKDLSERRSWGFSKDTEVAICIGNDGQTRRWVLKEWLASSALEAVVPWVVVFSDHGLTGRHEECKFKLAQLVGCDVRVWHHGGGADLATTKGAVWEKFSESFGTAGFIDDVPIMPFSPTTEFPWMPELRAVQAKIVEREQDVFVNVLNRAWSKAEAFFEVEKPLQAALEALFAAYVDVSNLGDRAEVESSCKADLVGAVRALNEHWREMATDDRNSIARYCWSRRGMAPEDVLVALVKRRALLRRHSFSPKTCCNQFIAAYRAASEKFTKSLGLSENETAIR